MYEWCSASFHSRGNSDITPLSSPHCCLSISQRVGRITMLVEAEGEAEVECAVLLNDSVVPLSAFDVWLDM